MIIETSALVAILANEPTAAALEVAIDRDPVRLISAVSLFEASVVLGSKLGARAEGELDGVLERINAIVVPFAAEHLAHAREGHDRFGRGRHPAGLNFGDCFSYALAKATGEPLLFVGDDFAQTDIQAVDWSTR